MAAAEQRRVALEALAEDVRGRFGDHAAAGVIFIRRRPGRVMVGLDPAGDYEDLIRKLCAAYNGRVEYTHNWEVERGSSER